MTPNDGFKLSTAATEIALNNRRLVENPENFGGQNWLLRLAARHEAKRPVDKHLGPPFHGTRCASDPDVSSYWREH